MCSKLTKKGCSGVFLPNFEQTSYVAHASIAYFVLYLFGRHYKMLLQFRFIKKNCLKILEKSLKNILQLLRGLQFDFCYLIRTGIWFGIAEITSIQNSLEAIHFFLFLTGSLLFLGISSKNQNCLWSWNLESKLIWICKTRW